MLKWFFTLCAAVIMAVIAMRANAADLIVAVEGVRNGKGEIRFALYDQPKEFLEFKKKRFEKKVQCMQWMSDHRQFIEHTLNRHIAPQKKGYFVDSIECLRISYFFKKSHNREYEV